MQLIDKLHGQLASLFRNYNSPESRKLTNINLRTAIKGFDKDLIGHIDYIFIDKRGDLHIYNFKTTHTDPSEWASIKKEKYKMQLAFLK